MTKTLKCDILADTEYIRNNNKVDLPDKSEEYSPDLLSKIAWNNLNNSLFDTIFPSVVSHGKIIDRYLHDPLANIHPTVQHKKILFHDPNADDPDWKVKCCYTVIIAAVTEVECGIYNLWKTGKFLGCRHYPDFGRYLPVNAFKAFCSTAAYGWCDPKYWYIDERDSPCEIFVPCLN